jgi:hypothetical protein
MKSLLSKENAIIRFRRDLRHAVTTARFYGLDAETIVKAVVDCARAELAKANERKQ